MKPRSRNSKSKVLGYVICTVLMGGLIRGAVAQQTFEANKKQKVSGTILSRSGDLVKIQEKKTGQTALIDLSDDTKIERKKDFRLRRTDMDVTAMVPGLTIDVEGVGNAKGQLDAKKIVFDPDTFAIEVAEEQQIQTNRGAAASAQSTANQGVAAAGQAQASADQAQQSANQAGQLAAGAGVAAITDAQAIQMVNQRVSDLGDYSTVEGAALFFDTGKAALSDNDKQALDKLAKDAATVQNYMIEIAGYASSTGTKAENEKLSDQRAAAVTDYLRNSANVPMRRILVPAGYGASHPVANNDSSLGRDINQRVDVKVIANKGLSEGTS
ncbi:MAG TPA: OmpA family protein [Alloacidobacterium sp.]|nr:OmpA family protein [Alloacidobacterium sp.]